MRRSGSFRCCSSQAVDTRVCGSSVISSPKEWSRFVLRLHPALGKVSPPQDDRGTTHPARIGERALVEPCLDEHDGETLEMPRFFGSECDGAFAEHTTVAARHAHPINSTLSDVELASLPCSYSTAENMLTRAQASNRDRILIIGASGGVGSAAVQLAVARGAEVIAVTGAPKSASLKALGANHLLGRDDDLAAALGADSVDVVLDLVADPQWPRLFWTYYAPTVAMPSQAPSSSWTSARST